jgi:hypothetical protein
MKADWREKDMTKPPWNERAKDYDLFLELAFPDGGVIARIEQFKANPRCFYANTPDQRSGCLGTLEWAKQWCEAKTGNRPN